MRHFVAFSSQDKIHAETIESAAQTADSPNSSYVIWSRQDASGTPVDRAVEDWLDDCSSIIADVTYINDNVTYEIGYAIGAGKNLRLIRNSSVSVDQIKQVGLLDTLLRDEFKTKSELVAILSNRPAPKNKWHKTTKDYLQPLYVLSPPQPTSITTKIYSAVKKQTRFKFRTYKAWEIARLTAQEAWEQVAASFGVVVTWQEGDDFEAKRNNQRAAFIFGLARGLDIPALLIAHERSELPSDLKDQGTRWSAPYDLPKIFEKFRDNVQDAINNYQTEKELPYILLDLIHCGDPAAENEQDYLKEYFLETDEFKKTLRGETNLVIGRKGSGKSAIFLQVRDRIRADKKNIVVDLNPEGYQLIKLKEVIQKLQDLGIRKEFIAAFWQYVLWLEIAYKILEKDEIAASRDGNLLERYQKLQNLFMARVDTGTGDFSERLQLLTEAISDRYKRKSDQFEVLVSSKILEIVYGTDIAQIRDEILEYLKLKGEILFLFDNLDRMRTPSGFDEMDALIILGLVESMQNLAKHFRRNKFDFQWVVFIRSDVYEFVVQAMSDYGKHGAISLDWGDEEVLKRLLQKRIQASLDKNQEWPEIWEKISVSHIQDQGTLEFIVHASLMRPRYIIRFFEMAKRRAINIGHQKIHEKDYLVALEELGWTVLEDLNLELKDIINDANLLLFDIAQLNGACGLTELREAIANRVGATDRVEKVIDILLWSGALGIAPTSKKSTFIFDCGYKLPFLRSLIDRNPDAEIILHPTLGNLFVDTLQISDAAE